MGKLQSFENFITTQGMHLKEKRIDCMKNHLIVGQKGEK